MIIQEEQKQCKYQPAPGSLATFFLLALIYLPIFGWKHLWGDSFDGLNNLSDDGRGLGVLLLLLVDLADRM
jgi:hypothetical protein